MVDIEQYRSLFDALHRALTAHVLRRIGDRTEADDVVAEIWATAWRRRDDVPEDPDRARMYVYGIARNVIANAHRSDRRRRALQVRAMAVSRVGEAERPHRHDLVLDAFERLPERDRELLRLVAWDGLGHAEVAELLGLSVTAVANRISRARRRLRDAVLDLEETANQRVRGS